MFDLTLLELSKVDCTNEQSLQIGVLIQCQEQSTISPISFNCVTDLFCSCCSIPIL